jgi:Ca2+-binding RTX toxin-like protein
LGGGGDQDHLVFREYGAANADTILSFASNWDDIQLDGSAFSAAGAAGRFSANDPRFYAAAGASGGHDSDDRLVYNTSTGQLYYDDDGAGAHAAQLVATLDGGATLAASDISVI